MIMMITKVFLTLLIINVMRNHAIVTPIVKVSNGKVFSKYKTDSITCMTCETENYWCKNEHRESFSCQGSCVKEHLTGSYLGWHKPKYRFYCIQPKEKEGCVIKYRKDVSKLKQNLNSKNLSF